MERKLIRVQRENIEPKLNFWYKTKDFHMPNFDCELLITYINGKQFAQVNAEIKNGQIFVNKKLFEKDFADFKILKM